MKMPHADLMEVLDRNPCSAETRYERRNLLKRLSRTNMRLLRHEVRKVTEARILKEQMKAKAFKPRSAHPL